MEKLKSGKIQIISHQEQGAATRGRSSKRFSFFGFSSSTPPHATPGASNVSPKEPLLRGIHLSKTSGQLAAIEKWVDLEEKIVHEYQNRKTSPSKSTPPRSTSSSVSYAAGMPALKQSSSGNSPFLRWSAVLWISGWAVAGLFAFFYARELPLKQDASLRIAGILAEKSSLEKSYTEVKTASEAQRSSLRQLNRRIQGMNGELKTFREKAAGADLLGKTYRQELMRITIDYEIQLDSLRGALRSRDEIIAALRAQMRAFEQMIDQGTLAAVSGVASRAADELSGRNTPDFLEPNEPLQGKVTQLNIRQGFFVVNIGSEHGARSEGVVGVYRDGILVGKGVMDRVYPTMSSVTMSSPKALYAIREGDLVSL